eukprot:scaffold605904_cov19-Prasinocladus_malaysianus.AAC.1
MSKQARLRQPIITQTRSSEFSIYVKPSSERSTITEAELAAVYCWLLALFNDWDTFTCIYYQTSRLRKARLFVG